MIRASASWQQAPGAAGVGPAWPLGSLQVAKAEGSVESWRAARSGCRRALVKWQIRCRRRQVGSRKAQPASHPVWSIQIAQWAHLAGMYCTGVGQTLLWDGVYFIGFGGGRDYPFRIGMAQTNPAHASHICLLHPHSSLSSTVWSSVFAGWDIIFSASKRRYTTKTQRTAAGRADRGRRIHSSAGQACYKEAAR